MAEFFEFEREFTESLHCIPMVVRFKLDTCGVKLKLDHWNHFDLAARMALIETPCGTSEEIQAYRDRLQAMVVDQTGSPAKDLPVEAQPPWLNGDNIPEATAAKLQEVGATLTVAQWQGLSPLQRFALIKLSRPSHENKNFLPALKEFQLL